VAHIRVEDNSANFFTTGRFVVGIQIAGPSSRASLVNTLKESLQCEGHLAVSAGFRDRDGDDALGVPPMSDKNAVIVLVGVKPLATLP
jgi:hypothetical protein